MSILRRIQQMRASLSGGSFLLEASGDLAAGDVLVIMKTSGAHQELPEEVTVTERGDGSFKLASETMALFSEGEEVIFGYFTDLKDRRVCSGTSPILTEAAAEIRWGSIFATV